MKRLYMLCASTVAALTLPSVAMAQADMAIGIMDSVVHHPVDFDTGNNPTTDIKGFVLKERCQSNSNSISSQYIDTRAIESMSFFLPSIDCPDPTMSFDIALSMEDGSTQSLSAQLPTKTTALWLNFDESTYALSNTPLVYPTMREWKHQQSS